MKKLKLEELNRPDVEVFKASEKFPVVLVLDNIRSALNVGSLFRTADAFALQSIFLCGITACPPHKEILKTALGSTHSVEWHYFEHSDDCVKALKEEGYKIYSLEQTTTSKSLNGDTFINGEQYAIVLGNEVDGVGEAFLNASDLILEIEQFGTKHSLNVAVCGGIAAFLAVQALKTF